MAFDPAPAALFLSAQAGSAEAMERLARMNAPLVRSIAARFSGRAELDDLVQTGNVGLIKAIMRFDPTLGNSFSTYAVPTVAGEIKRFLRDDGPIKVSRRYKELALNAMRLINEAEAAGEEPRMADIAGRLGADPADVASALEAMQPTVSLSEPIPSADGLTVADTLADPECIENAACDRALVEDLVSALRGRERALIGLRFCRGLTQTETAKRLGMSQAQVSRLEKSILARMRAFAGET